MKQVIKKEPKYIHMQQKFYEEFEAPSLIERKKFLEEIRSMKKPLRIENIFEHE